MIRKLDFRYNNKLQHHTIGSNIIHLVCIPVKSFYLVICVETVYKFSVSITLTNTLVTFTEWTHECHLVFPQNKYETRPCTKHHHESLNVRAAKLSVLKQKLETWNETLSLNVFPSYVVQNRKHAMEPFPIINGKSTKINPPGSHKENKS